MGKALGEGLVKSSEGRTKEARGERHKEERRERKRKQGENNNKKRVGEEEGADSQRKAEGVIV